MKMYYINKNKSIEIKGVDIIYRAGKMMLYGGFVSMICVGVNCSPLVVCVGITAVGKCL